jgi:hypothetical protein
MNALRLLAETLTKLGIPPDWLCVASPISIVLTAPEAEVREDRHEYAGDEAIKLARAWQLVRTACDRRDDIRPEYFSIGRA